MTYAPTRNNARQIARINGIIRRFGFMPVSGEDINSPRQSFVCEAQRGEGFSDFYESAWALVEHEYRSDADGDEGLFEKNAVEIEPDLLKRVYAFAKEARKRYGA